MATVDYGFFEALTGPMQSAGAIQQSRDKQKMQELQLLQQQRQMELNQLNKQAGQQEMLNKATSAALNDLYTKNKFARQKDLDDFRNWHTDMSGWSDIQNVLREHGSVDNARLYGNLDYLMQEYKANLKNNPISQKVNKNKAALELYHSYALDKEGNNKFITRGANQRYNDFVAGKTDNFIFHGPRQDYLSEATKTRTKAESVNLDDIIADNYSSIVVDMVNDINPKDPQSFMQNLSHQDMRLWVGQELKHYASGGIDYFGDKALYGEKDIDTEFSTELVRNIDATKATGIRKGSDWFALRDADVSFQDIFEGRVKGFEDISKQWQMLGGYDSSSQTKDYGGIFTKGRQVVGSGRLFANNRGLEDRVTEAWAGRYNDEDKTPKYSSKKRKVYDIDMVGIYDSFGHKIQDTDTGDWGGFAAWEEDEKMDLKLNGYHIALEGKNDRGDSFLLTDVDNKKDIEKMRQQYGNVTFDYVVVAELNDWDVGPDDVYYKKINLGDAHVQATLNKYIKSDRINEVKGQIATYEQRLAQDELAVKRKASNELKLQKYLDLPTTASVPEVIDAYDQTLTVGLGIANVPSSKIQQAVPLILTDLYVNSREAREYPVVMTRDAKGNPTEVANNSSEYMAYQTKKLKQGLASGDPSFEAMLEAIKTGNYDGYSRQIMNKNLYNSSRRITRSLLKYQNGR